MSKKPVKRREPAYLYRCNKCGKLREFADARTWFPTVCDARAARARFYRVKGGQDARGPGGAP